MYILKATEFWKEKAVNNIRFSFEYEPSGTAKLTPEQISSAMEQLAEAKKLQDGKFKVFGQIGRLDVYNRSNNDFTYCGYMMFSWNIGADLKCYPCCIQIYYDEYAFGDLKKQSLHEIIYGEGRKKYIEKFNVKRCNPCWLREKNITIETLLAPKKRLGHINFV